MFHITSNFFCIFSNTPPASSVAHIARDFLTYNPVHTIVPWELMHLGHFIHSWMNKNSSGFKIYVQPKTGLNFVLFIFLLVFLTMYFSIFSLCPGFICSRFDMGKKTSNRVRFIFTVKLKLYKFFRYFRRIL